MAPVLIKAGILWLNNVQTFLCNLLPFISLGLPFGTARKSGKREAFAIEEDYEKIALFVISLVVDFFFKLLGQDFSHARLHDARLLSSFNENATQELLSTLLIRHEH